MKVSQLQTSPCCVITLLIHRCKPIVSGCRWLVEGLGCWLNILPNHLRILLQVARQREANPDRPWCSYERRLTWNEGEWTRMGDDAAEVRHGRLEGWGGTNGEGGAHPETTVKNFQIPRLFLWESEFETESWQRMRMGETTTFLTSCMFYCCSSLAVSFLTPCREKWLHTKNLASACPLRGPLGHGS